MESPTNSVDFSQKLSELGQLSEALASASHHEFRQVFVAGVCKLLDVPVCILWEKLPGESKFKIVATHGNVDEEYQKLELDTAYPSIKRSLSKGAKIWYLPDVSQSVSRLVHIDHIKARKWISILSAVVNPSGETIGSINIFTTETRHFQAWEITLFNILADRLTAFLEKDMSLVLDRMLHELKSPIVGIRGHASFIQRRFNEVRSSPQLLDNKFEDILTECDILMYQIRQIEYLLGKNYTEKINREKVVVIRDIIIKTIYQFKFYIQEEYGFSFDQIHFDPNDSERITVLTDKPKLNQVVYNLLANAFKYAENDSSNFKLFIEVNEDNTNFIIKFKDWGIGIKEDDRDRVFEEGFRSSEAIAKTSGSGLGLNIARTIMRQLGGDLKLANNTKPTEFHLILPKYFQEHNNDTIYR
jgi:signal transduction histidine kinase